MFWPSPSAARFQGGNTLLPSTGGSHSQTPKESISLSVQMFEGSM